MGKVKNVLQYRKMEAAALRGEEKNEEIAMDDGINLLVQSALPLLYECNGGANVHFIGIPHRRMEIGSSSRSIPSASFYAYPTG
jgi:hypothetical protein